MVQIIFTNMTEYIVKIFLGEGLIENFVKYGETWEKRINDVILKIFNQSK